MNAISINRVLNAGSFRIPSIPRLDSPTKEPRLPNVEDTQSVESNPRSTKDTVKDTVEISAVGRAKASATGKRDLASKNNDDSGKATNLSDEEKTQVQELQKVDRQTRAHEQAHLSASGGLARGGASFNFTKGPDGRLYAVGGEVSIDTAPVSGDPDATIRKADTIRRAALAPSEPSSQDKAVAAQAAKMANESRAEKLREKQSDSLDENTDVNEAPKSPIEKNVNLEKTFNPEKAIGDLLDLVA